MDEAAGRQPAKRALDREGGILQVLENRSEGDEIEASRLTLGLFNRRQLQTIRRDAVTNRALSKARRRLETVCVEALTLERGDALAYAGSNIQRAGPAAASPELTEPAYLIGEVTRPRVEILRSPIRPPGRTRSARLGSREWAEGLNR